MEHSTVVNAPVEEVFEWHERKGAINRLLPPWQPLKVLKESDSLIRGTAVLGLPLHIKWSATHMESEFRDREQFVDKLTTPALDKLVPWKHTHKFEAVSATATRVTERVETRVPDQMLSQNLAYRARQLNGDLAAHSFAKSLGAESMAIAVSGSTGLIGSALCAFLSTGGHRVVRLVRSSTSNDSRYFEDRYWDTESPADDLLDGIDGVIHLAGSTVAGRFSQGHKAAIRDSRIGPTNKLAKLIGERPFVVASAIGIYGSDRGDTVLTESSGRGDGFLADVVSDWEAAANPARDSGSRVTHVRTGIVQSPKGGALQVLRPLFELGVGGHLGGGKQWTSWIGIDDMVDIYLRCLVDPCLSGPVNAVSPTPVRNIEYTKILARVLRRPAVLSVPAIGPKIILGTEAVEEFVLASQNVQPSVLERANHPFRFRELEPALRHLLGRAQNPAS